MPEPSWPLTSQGAVSKYSLYDRTMCISACRNLLTQCTVQGALEWLEASQDRTIEEINASEAADLKDETDPSVEPIALKPGEVAHSLVCNDCGKKFRSQAQAEIHASRTEHVNFAESTEEIAPLTEEDKKARLAELRQKLAEKREGMSEQDKLDKKKNEVCTTVLYT